MRILRKNLIDNKGVIKTKNIFGEKEPNIFFDSNLKSVNLPKFLFTNFLDSKKAPMVDCLKNERRRLLKKEVNFDSEYEIKDIKGKKEQKKIDEILKQTLGMPSINISTIFRLKYIDNPALQFFFLDDYNGNYHIIIVDIYHLILPAPDKEHHENVANPKKKYNEHKDASYCISNIFK